MKKNKADILTKMHWKFWQEDETVFTPKEEELIRKALEMNEIEDLEYLKNQEDLQGPHTFSPEFERKMDALFAESNQRTEKKKMFSSVRIPKVAIAGIFAVLITVVSVGIHTEAIPFPKFTYTQRKEEGAYAYLVEQEEDLKDTIEEKYELTDLPKGYEIDEVHDYADAFTIVYKNTSGQSSRYQQATKNVVIKVDDIFNNYKEMVFGESKYYVMDRKDITKLIWYADGYQYYIQMNLPVEELVKISKSIEKQ